MSQIKRNRRLIDQDVFSENAWDDFEWTNEMIEEAERKIHSQKEESKLAQVDIREIEDDVDGKWDLFYLSHRDKFFKDRKWILSEFQEICPYLQNNTRIPCNIFEVGCGVGNAVTQFLSVNESNNLHVYCCDISHNAIKTFQEREFYKTNQSRITCFQADISRDFDTKVQSSIGLNQIDFITLVFTLSALKPEAMHDVIENLTKLLKPGGMIFFRDYAKYDLTQLRFKGKSYLADNYYVRADGTTSYFFTKQLVDNLFSSVGLKQVELKDDNRLLVNRLKGLKMTRCWIQAKFMKPLDDR